VPRTNDPGGPRTRFRETAKTPRGRASRQKLIAAAREELIERSGSLEVESVAQRAGTSTGLIYRHFGNRAGLVGAVVDDFYTRYRAEALETNPAPGASMAVRERRRTELSVAFHYRDPLASVVLNNRHIDSEVVVEEMAHLNEMIDLAASVMRLGIKRGQIPRDRDPDLIAAMVIGGMRHVLARALSTGVSQKRATRQLWTFIAGVMGVDPDEA
jgi:AcrR family transcriptional regulator